MNTILLCGLVYLAGVLSPFIFLFVMLQIEEFKDRQYAKRYKKARQKMELEYDALPEDDRRKYFEDHADNLLYDWLGYPEGYSSLSENEKRNKYLGYRLNREVK